MSGNNTIQQPAGTQAPAAAPGQPAAPRPTVNGETVEQALARAQAAAQAKRLNEAGGICADVLAATPDHPAALALQGILAAMAGDPDRGVALLRRAIQIRPGNATWYAHLSSLCRSTYRMDEALAAGQESIRLDPNNPEHLVNLSLIFVDVDDRERAMACLLRALGLKHDHADGHLAMAQNLLAMGDFDPGWMEYEWRNLTEAGKATMPAMTSAHWNGMRIPNGRLLLVGDQGYGDTIQFARYIPMAAERCQELIVGCSAEMGPLLTNIPGVSQYCHRWTDVPGHAAHCRLSSLPYLFRTQLDSIPGGIPYLKADPARIATLARAAGGDAAGRGEAHRPGLDRPPDASERPAAVAAAGGAGVLRRGRAGGVRVVAEADAGAGPGGDAAVPRHDRSVGGADGFRRNGGADGEPGSGRHGGYLDGASGRRAGQAGVDPDPQGGGLALDAGSGGQPVVPVGPVVPAAEAGRLG